MTIQLSGKNMNIIPYSRIGGIIPEGMFTLVTGLPATGKSFTLLKFLNYHGVTPYLFNLDYDPTLLNFKLLGSTADPKLLKAFLDGEVDDLDNKVIIIDTYTRMVSDLGLTNTDIEQRNIDSSILELCRKKGYTIIVIGHVAHYATKSNIFTDNPYMVRDCHEQIHLDRIEATTKNPLYYRTTIVKNRGGSIKEPIIENWMR